ncbi:hypothetical protein LCM27_02760 [Ruegeria marisrubri]|uniref:hypothetical protein n=1 Tax=Ruegeria marisrubri TaxID=1685379 RepID=UPI001CD5B718|nr:hypothetical protein [Ruegeria marisrubri]MCA0905313.1 hypothetical protein [Ruegeria marisrubri]
MRLLLAALAVCVAGAANALTITFDNNFPNDPQSGLTTFQGTSQGFTFDYAPVYNFGNQINLHDDNGVLSTVVQAVNGTKFTAQSVDLSGLSRVFKTGSGPAPALGTQAYNQWLKAGTATVPTLTFSGLLNGATVATQTFGPSALNTFGLSSGFTAIDQLLITLNVPNAVKLPFGLGSNTVWCDQWCGEFNVDNLQVAPVPLPASGLLLFGAVLGLFGYRRLKAS